MKNRGGSYYKMILLTDKQKNILEWVYCILIAIVIAVLIRYFIGTPTVVKQTSMYPTLVQDQRLWLNRWPRTTKQMPNITYLSQIFTIFYTPPPFV